MAIANLDQAIAGMQPQVNVIKALTGTMVTGRTHSTFYQTGYPGAAVAPSPGLSGTSLTSYLGQIPFTNPVSGSTYLARFDGFCTQAGVLMLCDRLWHNSVSNLTLTTTQTFTGSQQIPARDVNGTNVGAGVMLGVEVITQTGAGTPTLTVGYTDTQGSVVSGTNRVPTVATSIVGTFHTIELAGCRCGVQKVNDITLSATWTTGAVSVVAYRVLARLNLNPAAPNSVDLITEGFKKLYDNTVPFLIFLPNTTTTSNVTALVAYTQG